MSGILWTPPAPEATPLWSFLIRVNKKYGLSLRTYADLLSWSVTDLSSFWAEVWDFTAIVYSEPYTSVLPTTTLFPRPDFFTGAKLNYAENLLFPGKVSLPATTPALITLTEQTTQSLPPDLTPYTHTWSILRTSVARARSALHFLGVGPHDIVTGYLGNHAEAIVGMLAAASLGAVWSSISPDSGVTAVVDRFAQLRPKVLLADDGTVYNGKEWPGLAKVEAVVKALGPLGLQKVVIVPVLGVSAEEVESTLGGTGVSVSGWDEFLAAAPQEPLTFTQLPPSHPLFILFSSGTTGLPKAIVHSALGTLIQHKKEHILHGSVGPSSRMLYFTTTSWMMWHWSVAALSTGASLVLYTGSPFKPHGPLSLPRLLSSLRVTDFGTSAAYLTALETASVQPTADPTIDLSPLRTIYSTASPLPPSTFRYIYSAFPSKIMLSSITGGTDIISLFGAPCPLLPVRAGALQCAGLGMDIAAVDSETGQLVPPGTPGDLVCLSPFPAQPLTFFVPGDEAAGLAKYRAAYFEQWPETAAIAGRAPGLVWHHGDFVQIPDMENRALVMLGRSDGVLKPQGVRFGSAEIYNILVRFFSTEIADSLCVGRRRLGDADETVCLFVETASGVEFTEDLAKRVKGKIREELSPRHVPGIVAEAKGGIPRTGNGKKIEVAVKKIVSGMEVKADGSVANPEALEWFKVWATENP